MEKYAVYQDQELVKDIPKQASEIQREKCRCGEGLLDRSSNICRCSKNGSKCYEAK